MSDKLIKHYTVSIFIISDGRPRKALLLHHRKYDKWLPPGGHQEAWENPIETAIRETKEETGLDISAYFTKPIPVSDHAVYLPLPHRLLEGEIPAHKDEPAHYHLDMEYIIVVPEQIVRHNERESHQIGWFTAEQIERLSTFEDIRTLLRQEL